MSVHKKPDTRWYVSYRDSTGKQRTKVFGRGNAARKEAEAFDLQLKSQRKLGRRPPSRKQEPQQVYVDSLAQAYIRDRKVAGVSQSYLKDLANLLNNHILPILCKKPVSALKYEDLLEVSEYYKERSQATRNRYFTYLRAIFRWGIRHGLVDSNPLKNWQRKKEMPRRSQLTVLDLKKIIAHAEPHLKWALEVSWNLGTRPGPSELLSIRWDHVDFERGVVSVYATKTSSWRGIPISPAFQARLLSMKARAQTDYLIEYQGKPMKKFRRSFATACRRAGVLYPCRMYDVRHLFASIMLSGGADLAAVSRLLGHSSTHMTANVYYELMRGEKERAVGLLPPVVEEEDNGGDKVIQLKMLSKNVIQ